MLMPLSAVRYVPPLKLYLQVSLSHVISVSSLVKMLWFYTRLNITLVASLVSVKNRSAQFFLQGKPMSVNSPPVNPNLHIACKG